MDKLKYVKIEENENKIPFTLEAQNVTMKAIGEDETSYNLQDIIGDVALITEQIDEQDTEEEKKEKEWNSKNINERLEYLKENKTDNDIENDIMSLSQNIENIQNIIGQDAENENPATGIKADLQNLLQNITTLNQNKINLPDEQGIAGQVLAINDQNHIGWQTPQDLGVGTDTTLSVSGKPADGKAVGDRFAEIDVGGESVTQKSIFNLAAFNPEMRILMLEPDGIDKFLGQQSQVSTSKLYYLQGSCYNYFDNNYDDLTAKNFYACIKDAKKPSQSSLIAFSLNDIKNRQISGLTSGASIGHGNDLEFLKDGSNYYVYVACGGNEGEGYTNCIMRIRVDPLTGKTISSITSNDSVIPIENRIPSDKAIWTVAYNPQDQYFYSCVDFNRTSTIYKFTKDLQLVEIITNVDTTGVYLKENTLTEDVSQGSFFRNGDLIIISNGLSQHTNTTGDFFYNHRTNFLNVIDLKTKKLKSVYSFPSWSPGSEVESIAYDPINDIGYAFSGQNWLQITQISFRTVGKIDKTNHNIFQNGYIIEKNTNLNNLFIPGKYTCIDGTLAASCVNTPPTMHWGFTLYVLPQAWDHIMQLIITNKMEIFIRSFNGVSDWDEWKSIVTVSKPKITKKTGKITFSGGSNPQKVISIQLENGYYNIVGFCSYPGASKTGARSCEIRLLNKQSATLQGAFQKVTSNHAYSALQVSFIGYLETGTYYLAAQSSEKTKSQGEAVLIVHQLS